MSGGMVRGCAEILTARGGRVGRRGGSDVGNRHKV